MPLLAVHLSCLVCSWRLRMSHWRCRMSFHYPIRPILSPVKFYFTLNLVWLPSEHLVDCRLQRMLAYPNILWFQWPREPICFRWPKEPFLLPRILTNCFKWAMSVKTRKNNKAGTVVGVTRGTVQRLMLSLSRRISSVIYSTSNLACRCLSERDGEGNVILCISYHFLNM